MKVSCIIPAFNEESTIKKVLNVVKEARIVGKVILSDDKPKNYGGGLY